MNRESRIEAPGLAMRVVLLLIGLLGWLLLSSNDFGVVDPAEE